MRNVGKPFSEADREKAVTMVAWSRHEYPSLRATCVAVAGVVGCSASTLYSWVQPKEKAKPTDADARLLRLEKDVQDLRLVLLKWATSNLDSLKNK